MLCRTPTAQVHDGPERFLSLFQFLVGFRSLQSARINDAGKPPGMHRTTDVAAASGFLKSRIESRRVIAAILGDQLLLIHPLNHPYRRPTAAATHVIPDTKTRFLWFYTKLPATGDANRRGGQENPGAGGNAVYWIEFGSCG
nr:hypothetical protein Iba_scaffold19168CG0020 [Ipomoea batatas]